MILYHTSDNEIKKPDIRFGRKNADFGQGFYLTPDSDFTYRWAARDSVVNIYEFDAAGLEIQTLSRDAEWFKYIFDNRRGSDTLAADVIIGPIANDTIFDTLGIISSGFLKADDALGLLMIGPEYIQIAIKTQRAADKLKWISSEHISRVDIQTFNKEQDSYQQALAEELERLTQ